MKKCGIDWKSLHILTPKRTKGGITGENISDCTHRAADRGSCRRRVVLHDRKRQQQDPGERNARRTWNEKEWLPMGVENIIYIKADQHTLVYDRCVKLKDAMKIEGSDPDLVYRLKEMRLYEFTKEEIMQKDKKPMVVFSVLKVIETIRKENLNVIIQNVGETDFILEYIESSKESQFIEKLKVALICIVTFFGSAFTIMAFNNDVSVQEVFDQFYAQITGGKKPFVSELEIGYCVGLAIGILVFFNHIGRKKITPDPTPIQVEMRKYEQDVSTTFIENASRKGHNQDVD
jgi:stage V sporulation protein AA